jgi:DNA modification methylase
MAAKKKPAAIVKAVAKSLTGKKSVATRARARTESRRAVVLHPVGEGGHQISLAPVADLTAYAKNARKHPPEQIEKLAALMLRLGYPGGSAVEYDAKSILKGHARTSAVRLIYSRGQSLFWSGSKAPIPVGMIPAVLVEGLSDSERRAMILADNRVALDSGWDDEMVRQELEALAAAEFDLAATGFDPAELEAILTASEGQKLTDPDDAPEAPAKPISRLGDIWQMGPHRLICGDATQAAATAALFGDAMPLMILTDPPYCSGGFQEAGKGVGSIGSQQIKKGGAFEGGIANDKLSTRGYVALMKQVLGAVQGVPVLYAFTDWRMWTTLYDVAESSGYGVRNMIVWKKPSPGMGRGWRTQHELVLFGSKAPIAFDNHKAQGNVIDAARTGNLIHPTQKPVDLLVAILNVTPGDIVYDPFTGSGSTLMACVTADDRRVFYGCELTPAFADVTVKRWQDHTGEAAVLDDGSGMTFAEVSATRGAELEAKRGRATKR